MTWRTQGESPGRRVQFVIQRLSSLAISRSGVAFGFLFEAHFFPLYSYSFWESAPVDASIVRGTASWIGNLGGASSAVRAQCNYLGV